MWNSDCNTLSEKPTAEYLGLKKENEADNIVLDFIHVIKIFLSMLMLYYSCCVYDYMCLCVFVCLTVLYIKLLII